MKLISKIVGATLGLAMAVGVSVGVAANNRKVTRLDATSSVMGTYTKVTSADGISAGDTVIMVNTAATKALTGISTTSTKYGTLYSFASGEVSNDKSSITLNNKDVEELTVEAGASSGQFSFKGTEDITNYLYWTSGNSLNQNATKDAKTSWTLTASNGTLTIANCSDANRLIRFNSDRFACYTTDTGTLAQLYKKAANVSVTGVSVSPTSVELGVGGTQQLTPTVAPADATNKGVSYSSSAAGIASVSASGLITAESAGEATITVTTTDGGFTATCDVTVTAPIAVTGVTLNKSETSIVIGSNETLVATVAPNNASNQSVSWTSSDDDVATVSNGVVTASGIGEATITVTTVDGGFTATCDVTVTAPSSVTFVGGTDVGTSSGQNDDTITKSGISMHCTSMYDSSGAYRFYSGSTLTFTSSIGNMSAIEFTGNDGSNKISNISTTVSTGTVTVNANANTASWSGNASSVSFTLSAQGRASQIVITMAPTGQTVTLDKDEISLKTNEAEGKQVSATVYNVDNINASSFVWAPAAGNKVTVEVVSTVGNTQTVAIKPNTNEAANTSVTLTISGTELSKVITVTISTPAPGETAGTAYSVAAAKTAIENADADISNVYITGIISKIDEVTTVATYWISDDGTTQNQFKIYRGKYLNQENFTSEDQIGLGDEVIVFGTISKQYTNLNANNYIHSLTSAPRVSSISLTPSSVTVDINGSGDVGDLFTDINIVQNAASHKTVNDIVWSSSDANVISISGSTYTVEGDHRDSATIKASIGGVEYGSATVTVIDSSISTMAFNTIVWTRVDDPSTLAAGDKVILTGVKSEVMYAAGLYAGGNNVPADTTNTLTASGDRVTGVVDTMVYTLEAGTSAGSIAFKDSLGNYLYAAGASSSNHMKTQNSKDANSSFVLNSDGTVVAQGSGSRAYMRYNNTSSNNMFSCYDSESTTGDLVTFYKRSGGVGEVDLPSLASIGTAYDDGNVAYARLGVSLSEADWDAIDSTIGISGYGVMLVRETTLEGKGFSSVEEAFRSNDANKPNLKDLSKASNVAPADGSIVAKINITNDSNRSVVFCAAAYVISENGTICFISEVRGSLVDLL